MTQTTIWTNDEARKLKELKTRGLTWREISEKVNKSPEGCRKYWQRLKNNSENTRCISVSRYPKWDKPLVMEGDAVILPDLELPFHDADFVNKVLKLAQEWGIKQCILAGDFIHFDSLSSWEAEYIDEEASLGISEEKERKLLEFVDKLPPEYQQAARDEILGIGKTGNDVSTELTEVRRVVKELSGVFERVDFVLGNHEQRLIRVLNTHLFPQELLRLIEAKEWRIAPYYFSVLVSNNQKFQIEHPKAASQATARKLASIHQCHIIMGHSHRWSVERDDSGKFWAIHAGRCVDETRLPYASVRHSTSGFHPLGAVIVKDGYPHVLSSDYPF